VGGQNSWRKLQSELKKKSLPVCGKWVLEKLEKQQKRKTQVAGLDM